MEEDFIERVNRKYTKICPICGHDHKLIPPEGLHYCAKCGSPIRPLNPNDDCTVYHEYTETDKAEYQKLKDQCYREFSKRRKLEEELFFLEKIKYGSFSSTVLSAFGIDYSDIKKGLYLCSVSIMMIIFVLFMALVCSTEEQSSLVGTIFLWIIGFFFILFSLVLGFLGILCFVNKFSTD